MPNLRGTVMRHVNVRVRYLDRDGVAHDEVERGLTAGTFQHECDHLDLKGKRIGAAQAGTASYHAVLLGLKH